VGRAGNGVDNIEWTAQPSEAIIVVNSRNQTLFPLPS
jgi:phosphoglycerate dehydrogenase-like enzyme